MNKKTIISIAKNQKCTPYPARNAQNEPNLNNFLIKLSDALIKTYSDMTRKPRQKTNPRDKPDRHNWRENQRPSTTMRRYKQSKALSANKEKNRGLTALAAALRQAMPGGT